MSTTAPTQRPAQVDDATRAALLLAVVADWHATHPQHILAARAALAMADESSFHVQLGRGEA